MSGLGWPRGRRGAHAAPGTPGGLGWPGRRGGDAAVEEPAPRHDAQLPVDVAGGELPSAAGTPADEPGESAAVVTPAVPAPAVPAEPAEAPAEVRPAEDAEPEAAEDVEPEIAPEVAPEVAPPVGPVAQPTTEPVAGTGVAPAERLRRTLQAEGGPDPLVEEMPIGQQAAAAARLRSPAAREVFPLPARRRILTVANQKGGVGKTTTTVNLAAALALHGATVLVVDLDPQGNCSTALGVPHSVGTPDVYSVLIEGRAIADVAVPADGVPGLRVVPATIDLAGAEIELVSVVARESRLQRALEAYLDGPGSDVHYVIVDCPPSLGLLTVNAMVATEELLIPIQCEYYALEGLGQLLKNVELVQAHLNPRLHVSTILLTMYDARTRLADQVAEEVRSHFGETVLTTRIPRSVRVSEAPGYGQTVLTYDPGSRGAIAYVAAAKELAQRGAQR